MAAQAAYVAETIARMNQKIARDQDSSDSEEPYLQPSNRGNKLKRKVHCLEDGQLENSRGPKVYKKSVEHAGYHRDILRRNPKRFDEDGYELDDSDVDEDADARAAEENPYAEIHLEDLLVPLTSAAKLPKHPSISVAYTSPVLTKMAEHASEMVQRERSTLADAKRLMTKLRGDEIWLPCGMMYSDSDEQIFDTGKLYNRSGAKKGIPSTNGITASIQIECKTDDASLSGSLKSFRSGMGVESARAAMTTSGDDSAMNVTNGIKTTEVNDIGRSEQFPRVSPVNSKGSVAPEEVPGTSEAGHAGSEGQIIRKSPDPTLSTAGERLPEGQVETGAGESTILDPGINGDTNMSSAQNNGVARNGSTSESVAEKVSTQQPVISDSGEPREDEVMDGIEEQDETKAEPRRMRTRAQAQAASEPIVSSRTESPDSYIPPEIHPLFKVPESAIPDKDFGLPPMEADETRRLLTLYVQKQEEVCRGAERLYEGLLCADQQRTMVLKWCKAEDHVGEMSDGEDWYDKEEWGLEEDLEKGHNDEEGETNNAIQGRKPRRRA